MSTRREARDLAFQILFEKTFTDSTVEEIIKLAGVSRDVIPDDYTIDTAEGACEKLSAIDPVIEKFSVKRSMARLSRVVLSVLRLAVYEILYEPTVDASVAINEAVELSKKYAGEDEAGFVNGVLGSFVRSDDYKLLCEAVSE